jgi:hypothetical protein
MAMHIVSHFNLSELDQLSSSNYDIYHSRKAPLPPESIHLPLRAIGRQMLLQIQLCWRTQNLHAEYLPPKSLKQKIQFLPPKTRDLNAEKYKWDSLESAFDALQVFAKETGFAGKNHTRDKQGEHIYI